MDLQLHNKVIIITGGLKGIGGGITLSLAREGAIPVIISRSNDRKFEEQLCSITKQYKIYIVFEIFVLKYIITTNSNGYICILS